MRMLTLLCLTLASAVTASSSSLSEADSRSGQRCYHKYVTVSVVKQVPSYSKHCTKVDDTKCKTIFKNAFTTQMETQCTPTFDTSCEPTLETAYRQQCRTIKDVECRIVNIEKYGKHHQKKICNEVPTQKCVPVPVKVEGQKCVNVPTQSCETVPVMASVSVPQKQCYKKPRKVCQTLVTTKPKVVTEQVPHEVCEHRAPVHSSITSAPRKQHKQVVGKPGEQNKKQELSGFHVRGQHPRLGHQQKAESEKVPVYEDPSMGYKNEDIPLYEEGRELGDQGYRRPAEETTNVFGNYEDTFGRGEAGEDEMQGYGSNPVGEEVEFGEYREREEARAEALHNYYKQLRGQQQAAIDELYQSHSEPYYDQVERQFTGQFGDGFENQIDSVMERVQQQVDSNMLTASPSDRVETMLRMEEEGQSFLAGDIDHQPVTGDEDL